MGRTNTIPALAGLAVLIVSLAVLAGWWLDIAVLKSVIPGAVSMKPNTALALALAALSLLICSGPSAGTAELHVARAAALAVLAIGVLTLFQYATGVSLGIDELLFRDDPDPVWTPYPGRMAVLSAISFVLAGGALAMIDWSPARVPFRPAEPCALLILFLASMDFLEYVLGAGNFFPGYPHTRMALHTAGAFLLLGAGILAARPYSELVRRIRAEFSGTLERRIWLALALCLAAITVAVTASAIAMRDFTARSRDVTRLQDARRATASLLSSLQDLEIGSRGYVITGDEAFLSPYHAAKVAVERQLRHLPPPPGRDGDVAGRLARIESLARERVRLARAEVEAARDRGVDAARDVIAAGAGKAVMDRLRSELEALDAGQVRRLAERERQQRLSSARLYWVLTADTLLALSAALVFGLLIHGEVRRRRGIEASLRRSEEDIAAVLESVADAIIAVDRAGRVTRLNAVAERLTGWSGAEACGRPYREVFRVLPSTPAGTADFVADVLGGGAARPLAGDPTLIDRRGTAWPVSASAAPVTEGHGRVTGAVVTFRDATEERETRRVLQEFSAELERRVQQRTEDLQRFMHIVRSASDMLAFRDRNDRFVVVNEAYCRYFGLRAEDIVGRTPDQLFTAGEYEELVGPLGARCLRGESVTAEGWITYPAMGRRYMELRYDPYLDAGGAVHGMVVAARDITERFQTEQRLRVSERHFRELINSSPSMVYEASAGNFWHPLFVSASVVEVTGFTPDEVLGEVDFWRGRLHPDDRDGALAALRAGIAAGACSTEYRFLHKDGNWRWLRDSFRVVDADGAERRIIGSWTDITRYMRTAGELRDSEARFKTVAQLGSDLIFEAALDGGEVTWFGDVDALLGLRTGLGPRTLAAWSEAIHPEDRGRVHDAVQAQITNPHADFAEEYRMQPSSGIERWWQVRARLLPDAHGALRKWVGSVRDVTQQRTIEKQLAQAQKMEAVGQLTGGVAHDFNNRLTTILGSLELLQRQLADQPGPLRLINMAIRAVEGGASLTRQLLTFSRRQVLESQVIDIADCVHGMVPLLRQTLGEDIDVRFVQHERPWFIRTDAGLFENALLNLALNARDAMPGGGRLIIETHNVLLEANYIQDHVYANPGEHVLISVSDTGAGIPRDVLPRVLEPFFTTKEPGRGTGLGLSMVYGFMRQSGGHVEVYSEEGHGTTVKLYFPRHTGAAPARTEAAAGDGEDLQSGRRILVVEDDASVRRLAATQLAELGYDVVEAEDGPGALRRSDELTELDLLFTDIIMPGGMTGMDLAVRLRRRWPDLEVIFTSGYTQRKLQSHGAGENARDHWLPKPYSFSTLASMVRGIVRAGSRRT